jgi:mediator of RNA polymerase II transcription subunit 12
MTIHSCPTLRVRILIQENGSRHRMILRTVPIHSSSAALLNQRKFALYGVNRARSQEEAIEKQMRHQIRQLLPEVFRG